MKEQILSHLPPDHPWRDQLQFFDVIDSTNTRAKELAAQGAPHGTALVADRQTGGRGRMGRSFHSPGGVGVYMSVLLRLQCPPQALMHLTCAAAAAACDAVERSAGIRPGIKWTNDLVVGQRKIAGILTELVLLPNEVCAVIGIGINCRQQETDFPPQIRSLAGSLAMATGRDIAPAAVCAALMEAFLQMSDTLLTHRDAMLDRYRRNCITLGRDISLVRGDEIRHGHALDVDGEGGLVVRFPDGSVETVRSGEVSIRGMYGYI
ncbi:MAG: biotin--[acetyl-CoA-carboxylase] ligase [Ruminococcaceae bacterium]|nr:biotin--[acetyl-CoA-carboxylase] ligase [Oscillospiraceae bacterium]